MEELIVSDVDATAKSLETDNTVDYLAQDDTTNDVPQYSPRITRSTSRKDKTTKTCKNISESVNEKVTGSLDSSTYCHDNCKFNENGLMTA